MILRSRIEAAERRVVVARVQLGHDRDRLGRAIRRRACSPQAHLVAFGAGFVWGLGPWGRAGAGSNKGAQLKALSRFAVRVGVTRALAGIFV